MPRDVPAGEEACVSTIIAMLTGIALDSKVCARRERAEALVAHDTIEKKQPGRKTPLPDKDTLMSTGLIVGRFQPLHNGHAKRITQILREHDHLKIAIGSAQYSHTQCNPFTFDERKEMLEAVFGKKSISIIALPDLHDRERWAGFAKSVIGHFDIVYAEDTSLVSRLFEAAGCTVMRHHREHGTSATRVRKALLHGEAWERMVPAPVATVLKRISAVERVRDAERRNIKKSPIRT